MNKKLLLAFIIMHIAMMIKGQNEMMIALDNYQISCKTYGISNGPSIVLINGMGHDQKTWNPIIPELSKKTIVFTYDPPNIGKSSKGLYPQAGDQAVKDLKMLLDKSNIPKPYIMVGHSFGGLYARLFAARYPNDMAGLIIEDGTPIGFNEAALDFLEGEEKELFQKFATMRSPAMSKTEELVKNSQLPQLPLIVLTAGDYRSLKNFKAETRVKTKALSRKLSNELAKSVPGGKEIIVEGSGHSIHIEKPQAVINAIISLLEN